ncbi:MAG: hypothetical protein ABL882_10515 [Sphingopyxis sp.]
MSGAMYSAVKAALIVALRDDAALAALVHHIDDGEAKTPPAPYGRVAEASASEWGAKDRPGHDLRIELLFADRGDGARLVDIGAAACRVIAAMPRVIDGWETSGFAVLRTRQVRARGGLNQMTISLRLRGWREV